MSYTATDEDLPSFFFEEIAPAGSELVPRKDSKGSDSGGNSSKQVAGVALFYPEIRVSRSAQRRRAAAIRSESEVCLQERRVFVKLSKKCQMWDWLQCLMERSISKMNDRERSFCTRLYTKFYRYKPEKTKWVTIKQYQFLRQIACQYLELPR